MAFTQPPPYSRKIITSTTDDGNVDRAWLDWFSTLLLELQALQAQADDAISRIEDLEAGP